MTVPDGTPDERPGAWVSDLEERGGIVGRWVAPLGLLAAGDEWEWHDGETGTSEMFDDPEWMAAQRRCPVIVTRWADGEVPAPPAPVPGDAGEPVEPNCWLCDLPRSSEVHADGDAPGAHGFHLANAPARPAAPVSTGGGTDEWCVVIDGADATIYGDEAAADDAYRAGSEHARLILGARFARPVSTGETATWCCAYGSTRKNCLASGRHRECGWAVDPAGDDRIGALLPLPLGAAASATLNVSADAAERPVPVDSADHEDLVGAASRTTNHEGDGTTAARPVSTGERPDTAEMRLAAHFVCDEINSGRGDDASDLFLAAADWIDAQPTPSPGETT